MPDPPSSALGALRDQLFVDTAEGSYLDGIGENHGVRRIPTIDDATWRKLLRLLMVAPKTTTERFERVLDVLLGGVVSIEYTGDPALQPPNLRVQVILDPARPSLPAVEVRIEESGVPADAPEAPGPVSIPSTGVSVGTPGSPDPVPAPAPELVVEAAIGGEAVVALAHPPILPGSVELWVRAASAALPDPIAIGPAFFRAREDGTIELDVLPAPLTFFATDPATGSPVPRPGLPAGATLLAVYSIDTRTFAGLAAALRRKLPPSYRVRTVERTGALAWEGLQQLDAELVAEPFPASPDPVPDAPPFRRLVTRVDLRSFSVHDVGVAPGPEDDPPTRPFVDRHTIGPRVFFDLTRRPDLTHPLAGARHASHVHDDFPASPGRPPPGSFLGPYVYTHDDRAQPWGRELVPGDPQTWEPFADEFGDVEVTNPATGLHEIVNVRLDGHAVNPFTRGPLATTILPATIAAPAETLAAPVLFRDFARPRPYRPRSDRSDHPFVLFAEDALVARAGQVLDLVRAAGVFVTFEQAPAPVSTSAPGWFCEPCYTEAESGLAG